MRAETTQPTIPPLAPNSSRQAPQPLVERWSISYEAEGRIRYAGLDGAATEPGLGVSLDGS